MRETDRKVVFVATGDIPAAVAGGVARRKGEEITLDCSRTGRPLDPNERSLIRMGVMESTEKAEVVEEGPTAEGGEE